MSNCNVLHTASLKPLSDGMAAGGGFRNARHGGPFLLLLLLLAISTAKMHFTIAERKTF